MGFVVIVVGLIMAYVGITGSQHTLMATLKGSNNPAPSGKTVTQSGTANANGQSVGSTDSNGNTLVSDA
jgi:hypothetical protein